MLVWIRSADNRAITSLEGRSRAVTGLSVFGSERRAATTRPPRTPAFPGKMNSSSSGFAVWEGAEEAPSTSNRTKMGTRRHDCCLIVFTNGYSPLWSLLQLRRHVRAPEDRFSRIALPGISTCELLNTM